MIIYIDLLILLNFIYDFLIIKVVSIVLKRNTNNKKIIISCLVGEISILFLLLNFNYVILIFNKIILAIIINIIAFNYKNFKYTLLNIIYFYMISIILGGFIYFLYLNKVNYIVIMFLVPIILLVYIIQETIKIKYQQYYKVVITLNNNHKLNVTGYLDTGNTLKSPMTLKPIIVINKEIIQDNNIKNPIYIPIKTINNINLMKCIKIKYIEINNKKISNILLGISENKIEIDGVDCLLNNSLRKEIEDA